MALYGKNYAYVSEIFDYGHSSRQIHFTAVDSDVTTLPMGFQLLKLAENGHFCHFCHVFAVLSTFSLTFWGINRRFSQEIPT